MSTLWFASPTTMPSRTVLMSWCRLNTLTPVTSWIIASMTGPSRFDQMGPYLFEQVPPIRGRDRLDQLLFSHGQHALEADHKEITDQVGVNVPGSTAHVLQLKASHEFANGGFDLAPCFHRNLSTAHSKWDIVLTAIRCLF